MASESFVDIFKICIGPSSSHTLGPWLAAKHFIELLKQEFSDAKEGDRPKSLEVQLRGSLAKTGLGHQTPLGLCLGFLGEDPATLSVDKLQAKLARFKRNAGFRFLGKHKLEFHPQKNIRFDYKTKVDYHPNMLLIMAKNSRGEVVCTRKYYSVGGGEVFMRLASKNKRSQLASKNKPSNKGKEKQVEPVINIQSKFRERIFPYPIEKAEDISRFAKKLRKNISEIVFLNEASWMEESEITSKANDIAWTMIESILNGFFSTQKKLPGQLGVYRRAGNMYRSLIGKEKASLQNLVEAAAKKNSRQGLKDFLGAMRKLKNTDHKSSGCWLTAFALAVNEQNAAFGRIVTAPTNGAAGVIPAVLMYYLCFENKQAGEREMRDFLLCAAEIGSLFKKGATLSAAMGGCQAEIGVSSAMAAAALTQQNGNDVSKSLASAEIAMEHHLGLTCDPISGLVQVPCIERNAMGAAKAITASQIAAMSDPRTLIVSLDQVIATMHQTALDMKDSYKETAEAGLAANVPVSLSEC